VHHCSQPAELLLPSKPTVRLQSWPEGTSAVDQDELFEEVAFEPITNIISKYGAPIAHH